MKTWLLAVASAAFFIAGATGAHAQGCKTRDTDPNFGLGENVPLRCDPTTGALLTSGGGGGAVTQSGIWSMRLQDGSGNAISSILGGANRGLAVSFLGTGGALAGVATNPVYASTSSASAGAASPTTTSTTYAAGDSIGGLQTVSVFRSSTIKTGTLGQLYAAIKNVTTQTPTLKVIVFEATPTASTCTNDAAFVLGAADIDKKVGEWSIALALATGSTMSDGSAEMAIPVINRDGSATANLYACVVTTASTTLASTSDLVFHMRVAQD